MLNFFSFLFLPVRCGFVYGDKIKSSMRSVSEVFTSLELCFHVPKCT